MSIQFECQRCGTSMSAPDSAAGKKGKCPNCGSVMPIPAPRVASTHVTCPGCGKMLRVPASAAGKKGKCPDCGEILRIPPPPPSVASQASSQTVSVTCPQCTHSVKALASAIGRQGRCPNCGSEFTISRDEDGLTPLADDGFGALVPLADDAGGLTPLDGSWESSFAPPADPLAIGQPLSGFTGQPLAPVGGYAAAMASVNPYASPYTAGFSRPSTTGTYNGAQVATIVCGIMLIVYGVLLAGTYAIQGISLLVNPDLMPSSAARANPDVGPNEIQWIRNMIGGMFAVAIVLAFAVASLVIAGAVQMVRFRAWGLALSACIAAMIPCNCVFFLMSLPLGIWGVVMLSLPTVRSRFR